MDYKYSLELKTINNDNDNNTIILEATVKHHIQCLTKDFIKYFLHLQRAEFNPAI